MWVDVVYIVRRGDNNEELRYSLRSLVNIPHDRVIIAGYTPSWVTNVLSIETEQLGRKTPNALGNLKAALAYKGLSDEFILMNDDFYILEPLESIPVLHRGPLDDVIEYYRREHPNGSYCKGMTDTREFQYQLGLTNLLSYELHVPFVFNKRMLSYILELAGRMRPDIYRLHYRTLYGNLYCIGGQQIDDVKIYDRYVRGDIRGAFASSKDATFTGLLKWDIHKMFPESSFYDLERQSDEFFTV